MVLQKIEKELIQVCDNSDRQRFSAISTTDQRSKKCFMCGIVSNECHVDFNVLGEIRRVSMCTSGMELMDVLIVY